MAETKQTQTDAFEEKFREELKATILVIRKLSPHCRNVEDLVGMLELAVSNDGQLHMLVNEIAPAGFRS